MNRSQIEALIRRAFRGVRLGKGCSLRDAEAADNYGKVGAEEDLFLYPDVEIEEDWSALSIKTLDRYSYLACMDAEGLRYYLPAFMLSVLAEYMPKDMRFICTLSALYPRRDGSADYTINQYALLTPQQRSAIACYLYRLPSLVELNAEDQKIVKRALRNYWHEFLPEKQKDNMSSA